MGEVRVKHRTCFVTGRPKHLASRGMMWMQQYDVPDTEDDELMYYLKESHRIASSGLTRKKQKEAGLNQNHQ